MHLDLPKLQFPLMGGAPGQPRANGAMSLSLIPFSVSLLQQRQAAQRRTQTFSFASFIPLSKPKAQGKTHAAGKTALSISFEAAV